MDCFASLAMTVMIGISATRLFAMRAEGEPTQFTFLTPVPIVIKHNYSGQEPIKPMGNAASAATAAPSGLLKIEKSGAVLTVGLNRPAKRNALNDGIMLAIQECFASLPDGTGAVVIHGIGDHFSSGLDLSELTEQDATEGLRHSQMWHRVFDRIQYSRVPVIAALKGAVIGGGLELACAAHIRVAEPSAYFALPEGQRGIFVGGGGSVRLPRLIGVARMTDMMLTGRVYSATEGAAYGFSQYLTETAGALPKALELAERVAANAPLTNFAVLQALPMIAEANPQTGLLMESLMATVAQSDKEAKRRIRAFLDRKTAKVKPT
jgi:enoyl-CoA hydratase/carnithine racemase